MDLREYTDLKNKVEALRRKAERAQGAYEQLLKRLKDEFGCDSLDAARALLNKTEREVKKAKERFEQAKTEFEQNWQEKLKELE